MKKIITHDLYDIASRIKQIDRDYIIYYDYNKNIYEVCHNGHVVKVLGKKLDKSCLDAMYISHVRNSRRIFQDMEENNEKLEKSSERELLRRSREEINHRIDYADRKGGDVDFSRVDATRWI